jgi:hypothetical protein
MLLADSPVYLVLGTCRDPGETGWLIGSIIDPVGGVDDRLLDDVADALIEQWFGVKRWTAERLWREALGAWVDVDGELLGRGVDLMDLPASRATSVVYKLLQGWRQGDRAKVEAWRRELDRPPARTAASPVQLGSAAQDFMAVMALSGGRGQM